MVRSIFAFTLSIFFVASVSAASVDDIPIKSSVTGKGETIVFVHGWTCDETAWEAQVRHFSDRFRVVTLDLPGHGSSGMPSPDQFSMDLFADSIEAVLSEIGAERVVLVGHSMGAVVIRQYALKHPEKVAGLVAVDGPIDLRNLQAPPRQPMTLEMRQALVEYFFVPSTSPELRSQIADMMLSTPAETAEGAYEAMVAPDKRPDEIIPAPTLSVLAGQTQLTSNPAHREIFPDWEVTTIAGTGHFLMMEQPQEFNRLLEDFLARRAEY